MSKRRIVIDVDYLWVREEPSKSAEQLRTVSKGEEYVCFEVQSNSNGEVWNKIAYGWVCASDSEKNYVKDIGEGGGEQDGSESGNDDGSSSMDADEFKETVEESDSFMDLDDVDFSQYVEGFGDYDTNVKSFLTNLKGVYGMPYQWMNEVDPKPEGSNYGREYTENIITRMPLLLLSPGKPIFMKGYSKDEQKDVINAFMIDKLGNTVDELLDKKNGRYYSFGFNYSEYYQYVNPLIQACAIFLGIGDEIFDGTPLRSYKWQNYTNSALKNFISSNESIAFYIDSPTQVSQSFSNSVGESQLMSMANSASDLSREVQFLMGGLSGMDMSKFQDNVAATQKDFEDFANKYLSGSVGKNLISSIVDTGLTTVVAGGKMIFPEIWNDSTYSRDYDITLKLRTPDYDKKSILINLFVPMMMIVALTAPQSLGTNGYKSPFLIKGYYKGYFNCNMGIITNLSISAGDKGGWTRAGLPTQIDINFTIKDLYGMLALTKSVNPIRFCQNTALIDWIANTCGININKPDIFRTVELYSAMIGNNAKNFVTFDGFSGVKQQMSNLLNNYFGR